MSEFGVLRDIEDHELELILSWRNAPIVRKNMYTRHEIGLTEHLAWWDKTKNDRRQRYFIYEFDKAPLGVVGFNNIDNESKNCFWAFYAATDAPRGTGSKMEYLAISYVFDQLGLHKLQCEVLAFNEAVIRLHQKFGFSVEGVFKDQHMIEDRYVDIFRLALLRSEWAGHQELMQKKLAKLTKVEV